MGKDMKALEAEEALIFVRLAGVNFVALIAAPELDTGD
jgi:hypothetical protein